MHMFESQQFFGSFVFVTKSSLCIHILRHREPLALSKCPKNKGPAHFFPRRVRALYGHQRGKSSFFAEAQTCGKQEVGIFGREGGNATGGAWGGVML